VTPVAAPSADAPESQRFVYGVNPVLELLRANPDRIDRLFALKGLSTSVAGELFSRANTAGVRVEMLDRERLSRLAPQGVHQGLVAEVRHFDYLELHQLITIAKKSARPPLYVVLDGLQDPHNFGAIVRSAHALGAHGVVVPTDRAVGVTGTVAKASAGAIEHTPIARVVNISRALEDLKESGAWVVAADPNGDRTLWQAQLDGPLVIVVGAEGGGVRPGVLSHCDFRVQIPMLGQVASLNASVSAAVLLAEVARQRSTRQAG
jgi:23S rRNA (guanosine2251-2'-O)-methyltransferase